LRHKRGSKQPIPGDMEEERELRDYDQYCICPECGNRTPIKDISIPCHKNESPEFNELMIKG